MRRTCAQCKTEMIEDCTVSVEGARYGIKISKKGKGLFNRISAKPKASVCPNCGFVAFYIDEFRAFDQ